MTLYEISYRTLTFVSANSPYDIGRIVYQLENQFGKLADSTSDCLRENKIEVKILMSRLANLPVKNKKMHKEFLEGLWRNIRKVDNATLEDVWIELGNYWDFLNYTLLEHLIGKFGDEALVAKMEAYKKKLQRFRHRTHLRVFAQYFKEVNKTFVDENVSKLLEVKFSKNWEECTLEDLEKWKENITQKLFLPSFVVLLDDIDSGCIKITWTIPALYASSLKEKIDTTFCEEHAILSMHIDGVELFSSSQSLSAGKPPKKMENNDITYPCIPDEVTCPVCLDIYSDPTQLPCGHVCCRECLQGLVIWMSQNQSISCPVCRNPTNNDIAAFPSDQQLSKLVKTYKERFPSHKEEQTAIGKAPNHDATKNDFDVLV